MPLVTSTEMFKKAYNGGYAVGAFNVNNMEIIQGITEACKEEHAPVILQVSKGARNYANPTYLVKLVEAAVIECPDIPIVLHLDHGDSFETCKSCIDGGFTSVDVYKRQSESGGFLHVSGLKYSILPRVASTIETTEQGEFVKVKGARRVCNVQVLNQKTGAYEAINVNKLYTLGGIDYTILYCGDGFSMFDTAKVIKAADAKYRCV